jgi:hypothetical protein
VLGERILEAQIFPAQSGAHTGAASKASTVSNAKAFANRARTGVVSFFLTSSRYPAVFQPSTLIATGVPI